MVIYILTHFEIDVRPLPWYDIDFLGLFDENSFLLSSKSEMFFNRTSNGGA